MYKCICYCLWSHVFETGDSLSPWTEHHWKDNTRWQHAHSLTIGCRQLSLSYSLFWRELFLLRRKMFMINNGRELTIHECRCLKFAGKSNFLGSSGKDECLQEDVKELATKLESKKDLRQKWKFFVSSNHFFLIININIFQLQLDFTDS